MARQGRYGKNHLFHVFRAVTMVDAVHQCTQFECYLIKAVTGSCKLIDDCSLHIYLVLLIFILVICSINN